MRLTIFLLILGTLAVQASGYAQKVSLSVRNANMESVFKDINKQTGYFFLYDADVLKKSGSISLDLNNAGLNDALKQVTAGKSLSYKIIDKTVIISELKPISSKQEITVKGTVRSETGSQSDLSLPGVVVTLKGARKSVGTNENGVYAISVPADAVLIFSMIGYGTQEIQVNGRQTIDVVLKETASDLQEVIITAFGTSEKKENQIGSAFVVNSKDLERRPLNRIDQLLEGLVPGLQYEIQGGIQGGNTSSIRPRYQTTIRGEASFGASSDPLWVLDGIPLNTGNENNSILGMNTSISPLTYLNPNDIESVVVLKDASATALYGADGSNGVILITTKKGVSGQRSVSYSFRSGLNLIGNNHLQVLNADQYQELYRESYQNNTALDQSKLVPQGNGSTDWYKEIFRTGVTTQHDLSLSGGIKNTRYYISGAYFKEKPIEISNDIQRLSTRINIDQKVNKSIDLFLRVGASYNTNKMFNPGNNYYANRPVDSPYDSEGNFVKDFYNVLDEAKYNQDQQKTNAFTGNVGGTISIIPGLNYTTTNGLDSRLSHEDIYGSMFANSNRDEGKAVFAKNKTFDWNSQHRLNYEKSLGKHDISALLAGEARSNRRRSSSITGYGFDNDDVRDANLAQRREYRLGGDEKTGISYYGQLRYTFANKYSLLGSFRKDANSDFGSDVRWANFSSVGAAWTISNEDFWNSKAVNFAKLKVSYGINGNSRIGSYKAKGVYSFTEQYLYDGELGAVMVSGENPRLSWETTRTINAGLSIGLFNRITLEAEFYNRTTKDMLDEVDVTRTVGFTSVTQNIGSVRNRGIEMNLITENIKSKNFGWTTIFNIARNTNKILKLYNNNSKVLDIAIREVGQDASTFYLIRWAGVDPRDGGPLWYDNRGNITKTFNLANRVTAGKATPDFFGGMTNRINYKSFSLSSLMIYNVGGYAFSRLQRDAESDGRNLAANNQSTNLLDRWREPGDLSNIPKTVLGENADNGRNSTRFLHKKTSLRLQNVSLNYSLPKTLIKKINLDRAGIYLQADNIGFWTPYSTPSDRNDFRNSFSPYPQPIVLSLGLNVSL